jgi:aspartyl-tRNA synthetase
MAGEPDIRQVIAFPKVASGSDPLTGAPTPMPDSVVKELGIRVIVDDGQAQAEGSDPEP